MKVTPNETTQQNPEETYFMWSALAALRLRAFCDLALKALTDER